MKKTIIIVLSIVIALVLLRIVLEPKEHPDPFAKFKESDLTIVKKELPDSLLSIQNVAAQIRAKRILLFGEDHHVIEPQQYFTNLLEQLSDSSIVILLELSENSQSDIDFYISTGEEKYLKAVFDKSNNLPLEHILRWSFKNKNKIKKVIAFDENFLHVGFNRLFLTDTRNGTMANVIYTSYINYPDSRIAAYGGQMHMLKGGRYRYDSESRIPIYTRLLNLGISRHSVCSIMLSGKGKFPLDSVWQTPGAILTKSALGKLPFEYFINSPVFRVGKAEELFDIFINLGSLTEISTNK